ncbi:right-handed parallel beta-helix repeat-containing protein [Staphylococcus ureilyticus]|uniref:right-handed parallel beta-helix repeat-containing protein n=1 Tax=Staphylococcus ureilyticus TaxID=94138 RepID=UPI00387B6AA2
MLRLQTNMSGQLDQRWRNETISNFKKIQKFSNDYESYMIYHQYDQLKAHDSKQITHANTTLDKMIIYLLNEVKNLVVGVDGDGVKEVTDARVGQDGTQHDILSQRLFTDFADVYTDINRVEEKISSINIDEYHPDKTGKTDVSDYIQDALNRIHNNGSGTLYIPAGKYLIGKRLIIYENTTVKMDNNAILLRGWGGGFFMNGPSEDAFYGYEGRGNIHFEGGTLDSNYEQIDKFKTTAIDMVILKHAENITFNNVRFRNLISYHCVDANGIRNLTFDNCTFEGFINLTGSNFKEAIQIGEYTAEGIGGAGYFDGTPCKEVSVKNCTFRKSDILDSFDVAIGNHYSVHNIYQEDIKIVGNTFEDIKQAAVRPYKWVNTKITENSFRRCYEGVRISSVGGEDKSASDVNGIPSGTPQAGRLFAINNNSFEEYKKTGVSVFGQQYNGINAPVQNIKVTNNFFVSDNNDVGEAIVMTMCDDMHIKDNTISYAYRGIRYKGCVNVFIEKNYINNIKTEGVYNEVSPYTGYYAQNKYINILNNLVNTTGKNGIYVQHASYSFVRSNTVSNPNTDNIDGNERGGIYLNNFDTGEVAHNHAYGSDKSFAIRGVNMKNTTIFNNGGSGGIFIDGDANTKIGYWNVSDYNNIIKTSTKGVY